jgi:hypothetical protein
LYFCGHGIQAHSALLLAEDIELEGNVYRKGAIDADGTFSRMVHCRARTQIFFLDCCRDEWNTITFKPDNLPRVLTPPRRDLPEWRDAVALRAASEGRQAYGEPGKITFFSEALISCLNGFAANRRVGERWSVTAHSLHESMRMYRWLPVLPPGYELSFEATTHTSTDTFGDVHETDPRNVLTYFGIRPEEALTGADLAIVAGAPQSAQLRGPRPAPWVLVLDPGLYEFHASFPALAYHGCSKERKVRVPRCSLLLKVSARR